MVKGVRGQGVSFIVTAREYRRATTDPKFWLGLVTDALGAATIHLVPSSEVRARLAVTPLAYKATLRRRRQVIAHAPRIDGGD